MEDILIFSTPILTEQTKTTSINTEISIHLKLIL